jgi:hypothetical protein
MTFNLSTFDQIARFTSGMAIIIAVLALEQAPVWLALIATYPVFTAILKWDPIYAAYLAARQKFSKNVAPIGGSYDVPV